MHRTGRTAWNGASGFAISLIDGTGKDKLREVEKLIRRALPKSGKLPVPANAVDLAAVRGAAADATR